MQASTQFAKNWLTPSNSSYSRWTKVQIFIGCLAVTYVISVIDPLGHWKLPTTILYMIPVLFLAWTDSGLRATQFAFISTGIWMAARIAYGVPVNWLMLIDVVLRLGGYISFGLVLARMKHLQENLRALAEERAQALAKEAARSLRLEREMMEAEEREQKRIGQDLHDGLCQHLTATALAARMVSDDLSDGRAVDDDARRVLELVEEGIALTREIAKGLYPIEAQNDGLMQALEDLAAKISRMFSVECAFVCNLPVLVDNPTVSANLYRIAQESISNALRHGKATRIEILLEESEVGIRLCVSDNGSGVSLPSQDNGGIGLRTMGDRARAIGGQFFLQAGLRGGVDAICVAPMR